MSDVIQEARARLVGRLKFEPEKRFTQKSQSVVNLTVESEGERDGRSFKCSHKACLWGHEADEFMASNPHQGDMVQVDGDLRNKSYEKNGQTIWQTEVVGTAKVVSIFTPQEPPPASDASGDDVPF